MDEPEELGATPGDEPLYEAPPPKYQLLHGWLRCITIALLLVMLFNLLAFLLFMGW